MESLISKDKKCILCGRTSPLHYHHIFYGNANRKLSDQDGMTCYLCYEHHEGNDGVHHGNRVLDLSLKREAQRVWERTYGDRQDFIRRYGKSYI